MNPNPQTEPGSPPKQEKAFVFQAARGCWASSIIVFFLLLFGKQTAPPVIIELAALVFILCGLGLGVAALFGIPKHGSPKILKPALVGMTINGFLLFIFITNFFAARNKALSQRSGHQGVKPIEERDKITATSQKEFKNGKISFQYDGQYQIKTIGEKGQIMLQCPDSYVVITDHGQKLDVADALGKLAGAIKADFQQHNYEDISEGEFENIETANFSGSKVKLEYTRPENLRVVAEIYMVSTKNNSYSFLHYYPQTQGAVAVLLFQTILNSFSEVGSALPAQ